MISFEILHLLVADHHLAVRNVCLDCLKVSVRFGKHLTFPERVADCFVVSVKFGCFVSSFEECLVKFLSLIINQKVKFLYRHPSYITAKNRHPYRF